MLMYLTSILYGSIFGVTVQRCHSDQQGGSANRIMETHEYNYEILESMTLSWQHLFSVIQCLFKVFDARKHVQFHPEASLIL